MLYLVATPIGNLEDVSFRALKTLFNVKTILCEDTRKTLGLLRTHQKNNEEIPELVSFYEENERWRIPLIIGRLKMGEEIALVTNAGTPTISDPGFRLVRECVKEKIKVVPIPGPCSPIAALSAAGLPTDKFMFLGFLPNKSSQRIKLFKEVAESLAHVSSTIIFFESPFRIVKSLADFKEIFTDREIVIARELTKIHEEIVCEKVSFLIEKYTKQEPKGELVVLFNLSG